jgi:ABC-2 type transport system ATP-binding protein
LGIIKVHNLVKKYGDLTALNNVTFEVNKGEILGVLGPNGAGKTTLLKSILGLVYPDSGTIFINEVDSKKNRSKVLQHIGAVLEGSRNIYHHLSPSQNMEYFYRLRGLPFNKSVKKRSKEILDILGLTDTSHKEVRKLSRGMQQKAAIACAFIHNPDILLLDEPTLGLDVEIANSMKNWFRDLVSIEKKTMLITSHNMHFIESICDRVLIINNGEIVKQSGINELRNHNSKPVYKIVIRDKFTELQKRALRKLGQIRFIENKESSEIIICLFDSKSIYNLFEILKSNENEIIEINKNQDDLEKIFLNLIQGND